MLKHPSTVIEPNTVTALRSMSSEAEKNAVLQPGQLDIIYEQRWFKLFVPTIYGGLEMNLPEALQLEEALAWTDGSIGWTVTLCGGANWFVGFLQPDIAARIFSGKEVCLAGSGRPSGIAKRVADGFEVTGNWNYATGAPHATIFTANCLIQEEDGRFLRDQNGDDVLYSFWFLKEEIILHNNWNCIGMMATASQGFEVKSLRVPSNRCFILEPGKAVLPQPVYHFPFLAFAEATLAVNSSGMAIHFFDLCEALFAEKEKQARHPAATVSLLNKKLAEAIRKLHQLRQSFYLVVEKAWDELLFHKTIESILLNDVSMASRRLAWEVRRLVDELYPYCGLVAANPSSTINRVWRDLHTASQHSLLNFD
jgi:indole-3-acetate monooxygenase